MKKYRAWLGAAAVFLAVLALVPESAGAVIAGTGAGFLQFLVNLLPVFLCVGLMDVWIEKDRMMKMMGEKSGLSGAWISLILGILTAVPVYALLPIAGLLLKKGGRLFHVLVFLGASVSIRVPLLLFESSALGLKFAACRFVLNLGVVFLVAFLVERLLPGREREKIYERNRESGD